MPEPKPIAFDKIISALLDDHTPFPPRYLHRLSDLPPEDARALAKAWPNISAARRIALLEDLQELNEADDLLSFEDVCRLALKEPQAESRLLAIQILRQYDLLELIPDFIHLAEGDPNTEVRAAAAGALGIFVYMGNVEELSSSTSQRIEKCLLELCRGQDEALVRRRALEALGFSSNEEVDALIKQAYDTRNQEWLISALFAMGRSADPAWKDQVLAMFDHSAPLVRAEAASAAGALELADARPLLLQMLRDPDQEVRMAAIWALSQIGGEDVRDTLEKLLEVTRDDEESELLENALENLEFTEEMQLFAILDITDEEDEELFSGDEDDEILSADEEDGADDRAGEGDIRT